MQFSENKFRSLRPHNQAKKCADLLRKLLSEPSPDWKAQLKHYNEMCRWQERSELCLNPQTLKPTPLLNAYNAWRDLAGLGPEQEVLALPFEMDRTEALQAPIAWKVWMHNMRSAHNVGSILRTADCFGWEEAWMSGYTPDATHKSVRGAAMGAEQWVPSRKGETQDFLEIIKEQHLPLFALEITPNAQIVGQFPWPPQGVLLLGNEELGVDPKLIAHCKGVLKIPMFGRKGSMNVANAFAITAFDARRILSADLEA